MNKKAVGTIAIAAALIAALAVPVFAEAGLRNGRLKDKRAVATAKQDAKKAQKSVKKAQGSTEASRTAAKEQRKAERKAAQAVRLEKRISNKLAARKHRFDAVNANLTKRLNRVASLATTVAAAGGDVTAVNAKLDSARAHLATALALEQEAIAKFKAIPAAQDKRAAFFDARAKGREAVAELKLARFAIRDAAQLLRSVVEGLKGA